MGVYLCAKFEISSIILTGFKQRGDFNPPFPTKAHHHKRQPILGLVTIALLISVTISWYIIKHQRKHLLPFHNTNNKIKQVLY